MKSRKVQNFKSNCKSYFTALITSLWFLWLCRRMKRQWIIRWSDLSLWVMRLASCSSTEATEATEVFSSKRTRVDHYEELDFVITLFLFSLELLDFSRFWIFGCSFLDRLGLPLAFRDYTIIFIFTVIFLSLEWRIVYSLRRNTFSAWIRFPTVMVFVFRCLSWSSWCWSWLSLWLLF